jgi:anhydro-N-acetylmuramic acid kinase
VSKALFIGLMSGTSLDGVDAALVQFDDSAQSGNERCRVMHTHSLPYSAELRAELLSLHTNGENELERTALVGNTLAKLYAQTVTQLLASADLNESQISAIGCHGQTIRHRPELGFTLQIGNPALLTELTGITVVADFRSRDIAAGGQGAPLVPAFHQAVFAHPTLNRTVINIGGIANLSNLPSNGIVSGFDSGPGNMLMDAWAERHLGKRFDESGNWAATGQIIERLLIQLLTETFFHQPPPKSTGRDLFSLTWLEQFLQPGYSPQDVQRTLLELTARSIANAATQYCGKINEIYLCGGGAHNLVLLQRLQQLLHPVKIRLSDDLGIAVGWVEAAAFAWLAKQALLQAPGNLPTVTGAKGVRVLGAIYAH